MTKKTYPIVLFVVAVFLFLSAVLLNRREYQDSWILADILLPTLILVFTFSLAIVYTSNNKAIVLICVVFFILLNLVPALKYEIFYGEWDVTYHYRWTRELIDAGFVPKANQFFPYGDTPGLEIFLTTLSLITKLSLNGVFKYTLPLIFGSLPLLAYFVANRVFTDRAMQKYCIIAASIPSINAFEVMGSKWSLPFYFLYLSLIFLLGRRTQQNKIGITIIVILIAAAILVSHSVTPIFILLSLLASLIVLFIGIELFRREKSQIRPILYTVSVALILSMAAFLSWWYFISRLIFDKVMHFFQSFVMLQDIPRQAIPQRFFEIPLLSQFKIFALYHTATIIVFILAIVGMFALIRKHNGAKVFHLYLLSAIIVASCITLAELATEQGELEYKRLIWYASVLSPFFVGLTFWWFDKSLLLYKEHIRKPVIFLSISIIICLCFVSFFPYQPLCPNASELSPDLPNDEPIMYFHTVHTIYQEKMISFFDEYHPDEDELVTKSTEGQWIWRITADLTTQNQIKALGSLELYHYLRAIYVRHLEVDDPYWSYFLLHWPGKSGFFGEQVELRTTDRIREFRNRIGLNIVYDNGESFIVQRIPPSG